VDFVKKCEVICKERVNGKKGRAGPAKSTIGAFAGIPKELLTFFPILLLRDSLHCRVGYWKQSQIESKQEVCPQNGENARRREQPVTRSIAGYLR
jgi:hypothetical protein